MKASPIIALLMSTLTCLSSLDGKSPDPRDTSTRIEWRTEAGDQLACDGAFYRFRTADGLRGFKVWVPPQKEAVRGLILFGNPGGGYGGDTREKSRQMDLLEFAGREGFAVAGVTGFPGRQVYSELGAIILRGLRAMGELGHHPELAHIPYIATGGSNAGSFSYGMLCLAPERTIAITPNVGGYHDLDPPLAALAVPAWIHIGTLDELSSTGVERTEELFRMNSQRGDFLWTWDAEMKGHENGGADHVDFAFWESVIGLRIPREFVRGQPVALQALDPSSGWYADLRSWDHRITRVFPASQLPQDPEPGRYGWLPSESMARLYQANATRSRPIFLEFLDAPEVDLSGASGVYLSAAEGYIANPGDTIRLRVTTKPFGWNIVDVGIYDRGQLLGRVDPHGENEFSFTVDGSRKVYALHAYAVDSRGAERVSAPLQILVRDPAVSARIAEQLAPLTLARVAPSRAVSPTPPAPAPAPGKDKALVAAGIAPEPATLGPCGLSAFWEDPSADALVIDGRFVVDGSSPPDGTVLTVQARWSKDGLWFLFTTESEDWSSPADSLAHTVDFHLASLDPAILKGPAESVRSHLAKPSDTFLLSSAVQIKVPLAQEETHPSLSLNFWDPWDSRSEVWAAASSWAGSGARATCVVSSESRRSVELFLPWPVVGNPGFSSAPFPGSRLTLMIGYRTRSGQTQLAWPERLDPWAVTPSPEAVIPFGQLILGPIAQ